MFVQSLENELKGKRKKGVIGSLSNHDGDDNENGKKKTIGLGLVHTYRGIFEKGEFCPPFLKKYASTRSVFESFSPAHAKTLNNVKTKVSLTKHA